MINDMTFEDYAAQWGCDPVYDKAPRIRGDGYMFYNFAVEGQDHCFLLRFMFAIDRTIAGTEDEQDKADLEELNNEVKRRLGRRKRRLGRR